jgi:hypothetical protein
MDLANMDKETGRSFDKSLGLLNDRNVERDVDRAISLYDHKKILNTDKIIKYDCKFNLSLWLIGFIAAFGLSSMPLLSNLAYYLPILLHECGHTVAAWYFGRMAIPSFDFGDGGGMTYWHDPSYFMLALIDLTLIAIAIIFRPFPRWRLALIIFLTIQWIALFTGLDQIFLVLMGHGGELVSATWLLYTSLNPLNFSYNRFDRLVLAFLGFFFVFYSAGFYHNIIFNPFFRSNYLQGKSFVDNDLVIASRLLHMPLEVIAWLLLIATCLLPISIFLRMQMKVINHSSLQEFDA